MLIKLFLPILAGLSIVLQGTLNRSSASQLGLISAVFLNSLVFLVFSGILWWLMKYGYLGEGMALSAKPLENLQWWQILPGVLGFAIVLCTPLSISYLGATVTFAVIICTQLGVSLLWDSWAHKTPPTLTGFVGVVIMVVGAGLVIFGKK